MNRTALVVIVLCVLCLLLLLVGFVVLRRPRHDDTPKKSAPSSSSSSSLTALRKVAEDTTTSRRFFAKCIYSNSSTCNHFDVEISAATIKTTVPGNPQSPLNDEFDTSLSISKNGSVMHVVDTNSNEFKSLTRIDSTDKMCIKIVHPDATIGRQGVTTSYYLLYPVSEVPLQCVSTNSGKCVDMTLVNGTLIQSKDKAYASQNDELLEPTANVRYLSTKNGSVIFPDQESNRLTIVNTRNMITAANGKQTPTVSKYQVPEASASSLHTPPAIRDRRMTVTPEGLYRHDL